jgi:SAM-dependent methyltransferase
MQMNLSSPTTSECDRIRERYERRKRVPADRYSPLAPDVILTKQEKFRAMVRLFRRADMLPVYNKNALEVGCGSGANLRLLLDMGFLPGNLAGNDLLEERCVQARASLPAGVRIVGGDATELSFPDGASDIVIQSTVFSSILDVAFRRKLAARMWRLVRPGGGVLWYDFMYNNPRNPDVRGIPFREITELFPQGKISGERVTLAPPLARRVAPIHPGLYALLNAVPLLRSHWICWIRK